MCPDTQGINIPIKILAHSELHETDPATWTLPRTIELLDECVATIKEIKPDLILYDFFSLEGYFAGKRLNIPYWCSIPALIGPFDTRDYLEQKLGSPENITALKLLGIDPRIIEVVSDGLHIPGKRNLVWSYPSLTPGNFLQNRNNNVPYTFVGNLTKTSKTHKVRQRPLIYFSLGTVVMDNLWNQQTETRKNLKIFIETVVQKWKDQSFDVLFVDRGKSILEEYPKNWHVVEHANQIEALSEATLFVTHAGSNSFHEAVKQKVPMIAIPFFGDQPLVARQIEKLGIGTNLVQNDEIDTKKQKNFINRELAEQLNESVQYMLNNLEMYKKNLSELPLESEDISELFNR